MPSKSTHKIQISLSDDLFDKLRTEAELAQRSTAEIILQAIDVWFRQKHDRKTSDDLSAEIAAYVTENAGTEFDLDPTLETAGIECLLEEVK